MSNNMMESVGPLHELHRLVCAAAAPRSLAHQVRSSFALGPPTFPPAPCKTERAGVPAYPDCWGPEALRQLPCAPTSTRGDHRPLRSADGSVWEALRLPRRY